jgi:AhpD family alkylhydroperoxidase
VESRRAVFAGGALDRKTNHLIAVALAHGTQCPYCITGAHQLASREGVDAEEIMMSIRLAGEMRVGGAYAQSTLALRALAADESADGPTEHHMGLGAPSSAPSVKGKFPAQA